MKSLQSANPLTDNMEILELTARSFNALPLSAVLIDSDGLIKLVNDSWRLFAIDNGIKDISVVLPGINYLEVCRRAAKEGDLSAREALEGIEAVLRGEFPEFLLEYPCHSPGEQRWFIMKAKLLEDGYLLIVHLNITERKLLE